MRRDLLVIVAVALVLVLVGVALNLPHHHADPARDPAHRWACQQVRQQVIQDGLDPSQAITCP